MRRKEKNILIISCVILLFFWYCGSISDETVIQRGESEKSIPNVSYKDSSHKDGAYKDGNYRAKRLGRLAGRIYVQNDTSSAPSFEAILRMNGFSPMGQGYHKSVSFDSNQKVAILIPFRDRETQLRVLLHHLFPILRRQQISFAIYVINLAGNGLFNRAKLFNVGITESLKDQDFDCFIFHDTDLLLRDDRCLYRCHEDNPIHLSRYIDIFDNRPLNYSIKCPPPGSLNKFEGFGGVSAMTRKQAFDVNGFSNYYWGWGGEDDDMILRLRQKGYQELQPVEHYCSYLMIRHEREQRNIMNQGRYKLLYDSINRMNTEGLNSLMYDVISVERNPMYINVTVEIGNDVKSSQYVSEYLQHVCEESELATPSIRLAETSAVTHHPAD